MSGVGVAGGIVGSGVIVTDSIAVSMIFANSTLGSASDSELPLSEVRHAILPTNIDKPTSKSTILRGMLFMKITTRLFFINELYL